MTASDYAAMPVRRLADGHCCARTVILVDTPTLLVSLVMAVLGSGALTGYITARMGRKKTAAEASAIVADGAAAQVEGWRTLAESLSGRIAALELRMEQREHERVAEVALLEKELADARHRIAALEQDLGTAMGTIATLTAAR